MGAQRGVTPQLSERCLGCLLLLRERCSPLSHPAELLLGLFPFPKAPVGARLLQQGVVVPLLNEASFIQNQNPVAGCRRGELVLIIKTVRSCWPRIELRISAAVLLSTLANASSSTSRGA